MPHDKPLFSEMDLGISGVVLGDIREFINHLEQTMDVMRELGADRSDVLSGVAEIVASMLAKAIHSTVSGPPIVEDAAIGVFLEDVLMRYPGAKERMGL